MALLTAMPALAALGLAVTFPDMVLEQIAPGTVFHSLKDRSIPYLVMNRSDGPIDVEVLLEARDAKDVKAGYEPIPDTSWLKVVPETFHLEKGEKMQADLIVSIPKDKKLIGRHFEAGVHSRTVGSGFLSAGVMHRVYLSIGVPAPTEKPVQAPSKAPRKK